MAESGTVEFNATAELRSLADQMNEKLSHMGPIDNMGYLDKSSTMVADTVSEFINIVTKRTSTPLCEDGIQGRAVCVDLDNDEKMWFIVMDQCDMQRSDHTPRYIMVMFFPQGAPHGHTYTDAHGALTMAQHASVYGLFAKKNAF